MFLISFSILWSFSYFFLFVYITIIFSLILYALPSVKDLINYSKFKKNSNFDYLTGFDFYFILLTPLFLFFLINFSWSSYSLSSWFGNIIFTSFQFKISFVVIFFFFYDNNSLLDFFLFFF